MATDKIFFSYSRSDSTFVLKLAKDLRESGIKLWLDQLDIKPGSHWDASIQQALTESRKLIVILSDSSVKSDNVMDEVSWALENGKTVIPVMISECSPPFRLMRLQRIDFTNDYQSGLDLLLETLKYTQEIPDSSENKTEEEKPIIPDVPVIPVLKQEQPKSKAETDKKDKEKRPEPIIPVKEVPSKKKSKKYFFIGGGLVIIALFSWMIIQSGVKREAEAAAEMAKQDSIYAVQRAKDSLDLAIKKEAKDKATKDSLDIVKNVKLGNTYQGGIIFYIDPSGQHGLIAAQFDAEKKLEWYPGSKIIAGAYSTGIFKGKDNTQKIVDKLGEGTYAAQYCAILDHDGYSDWYLPSKDELDLLYQAYKNDVIPGFAHAYYWSSTEISNKDVYYKSFWDGQSYVDIKGNHPNKVRAIRSF